MEHTNTDDVDFAFLITDDEEKPGAFFVEIDLTSSEEEVIDLTADADDEDVDMYEDLSLVLLASDEMEPLDYSDYESLSDLSEDEFMEERAGSGGSAASPIDDNSPQELEFSEEDLLDADCSMLTASINTFSALGF